MKSREFVTEGPQSGDYQRMLDFVNTNKTPGVPPEQQIALPGVQPVAEDKLFKLIKWATGK